ncbi:MAG: hypothetical protein JJU29_16055 [Verrucomicrobia bacterium]|nr:hypothetical protein [Verrucomicrobiota bacterium]
MKDVDLNQIHFGEKGLINWMFVFGAVFVSAPIISTIISVIGVLMLCLFKNYKGVDKTEKKELWRRNLSLISSKGDVTQTDEVAETDERTSIEFWKYFIDILNIGFSNEKISKLIIVIDNLDRIDEKEALKVWSTLQTFFQTNDHSTYEKKTMGKIWVIVPYDREGLSKLWRNDNNNKSIEIIDSANSFFDKCFQLRLEVPKPIMTGWECFAENCINEGLYGWPEREREEVLQVLKRTRRNLADVPTPRAVKTFVNQVGALRKISDNSITTKSICYYVIIRFIRENSWSVDKVRESLLNSQWNDDADKRYIDESELGEISGLIFGVSKNKGMQLLLIPELSKLLDSGDGDKLRAMAKRFGPGFWPPFEYLMHSQGNSVHNIYQSKGILNGLWEEYSSKILPYIKNSDTIKTEFPDTSTVEAMVCHIKLLQQSNLNVHGLWYKLMSKFDRYMNSDKGIAADDISKNLKACWNVIDEKPEVFINSNIEVPENWLSWADVTNKNFQDACKLYAPKGDQDEKLSELIVPGKEVDPRMLHLLEYCIGCDQNQWMKLVEACVSHINHQNGAGGQALHSVVILHILLKTYNIDDEAKKKIAEVSKTHQFWTMVHDQRRDKTFTTVGYVFALIAFDGEMQNSNVQQNGNATAGFATAKTFWSQRSRDNAVSVFEIINKYNLNDLVWNSASDHNNALIADIFSIYLDMDSEFFFSTHNFFERFGVLLEWSKEIGKNMGVVELANYLVDNFSLDSKLAELTPDSIKEKCLMFQVLVDAAGSKIDLSAFDKPINEITVEDWMNSLQNDTCMWKVPCAIRKHNNKFNLGLSLYEALYKYSELWARNEASPSAELIDSWVDLVSVLDKSSFENYCYRVTISVFKCDLNVDESFVRSHANFIDPNILVEKIQGRVYVLLEDAVANSNQIGKLMLILLVLQSAKIEFNPEQVSVLQENIESRLVVEENENYKLLFTELLKALGIKVKKLKETKDSGSSTKNKAAKGKKP